MFFKMMRIILEDLKDFENHFIKINKINYNSEINDAPQGKNLTNIVFNDI